MSDSAEMPREIWAGIDTDFDGDELSGWWGLGKGEFQRVSYTRTDLVAGLVEAVLAVNGHDKINPDDVECPIRWDEWAYIREELVAEVLRLGVAYGRLTDD